MSVRISERAFEDAIEAALLRYGPDEGPAVPDSVAETAPYYGDPDMRPGGYRKRGAEDYERALCLLPRDVIDFVRRPSRRSGNGSRSTTGRRRGSGS